MVTGITGQALNKASLEPFPPLRGRGLGVGGVHPRSLHFSLTKAWVNGPLPAGVKGSGSPPSRGKRKEENKAPYGPSGHFPLWGKYRRSRGRGASPFSPPRHCEAHCAEATQGNIISGPRQTPGLLRCARNDANFPIILILSPSKDEDVLSTHQTCAHGQFFVSPRFAKR